jgi:PRTRC genetic system protein E
MFRELMPMIENRALTITVVQVSDGKIKLCVVPHALEKDNEINKKVGCRKEVPKISEQALKALTTPLSMEGTPEELDAGLVQQLSSYAEVHTKLQHGIAEATQRINAALNEIEEREKDKTKAKATAPANKKEEDQKSDKVETKPSTETTLPLDWCAPASGNATSPNEPSQPKGCAQ